MGIARQILQTDLAYSEWATRRLLAASAALTPEEATRDLRQSHRSVLATLNHFFISERFWIECLESNRLPPFAEIGGPAPPDLPLAELEPAWSAVWNAFARWFAPLSDEDLAHTLRARLPSGTEVDLARWQLLRHSLNHATLHRGQIVGMLRQMDKQPPNIDVMGYYLSN
jgi:uncharacterized damage-inducible protein DinB